MRRMLDEAIYYATAPIRLFGRSRRFRLALGAAASSSPASSPPRCGRSTASCPPTAALETAMATLHPLPPLPPSPRSSYVIAPVAVALAAIRAAWTPPRRASSPARTTTRSSSLLSKADIGITIGARRHGASTASRTRLTVTAPLNGTLQHHRSDRGASRQRHRRASPACSTSRSARPSASSPARCSTRRAELHGQVIVHAKPALTANWRLEPNLTAQVALGDSAVHARRYQARHVERGAAADRPRGQRADRRPADAAAQRSLHRARGARAMGQDVPLDPARRRRYRPAASCGWKCARCAPPPRSRRSTPAT